MVRQVMIKEMVLSKTTYTDRIPNAYSNLGYGPVHSVYYKNVLRCQHTQDLVDILRCMFDALLYFPAAC